MIHENRGKLKLSLCGGHSEPVSPSELAQDAPGQDQRSRVPASAVPAARLLVPGGPAPVGLPGALAGLELECAVTVVHRVATGRMSGGVKLSREAGHVVPELPLLPESPILDVQILGGSHVATRAHKRKPEREAVHGAVRSNVERNVVPSLALGARPMAYLRTWRYGRGLQCGRWGWWLDRGRGSSCWARRMRSQQQRQKALPLPGWRHGPQPDRARCSDPLLGCERIGPCTVGAAGQHQQQDYQHQYGEPECGHGILPSLPEETASPVMLPVREPPLCVHFRCLEQRVRWASW